MYTGYDRLTHWRKHFCTCDVFLEDCHPIHCQGHGKPLKPKDIHKQRVDRKTIDNRNNSSAIRLTTREGSTSAFAQTGKKRTKYTNSFIAKLLFQNVYVCVCVCVWGGGGGGGGLAKFYSICIWFSPEIEKCIMLNLRQHSQWVRGVLPHWQPLSWRARSSSPLLTTVSRSKTCRSTECSSNPWRCSSSSSEGDAENVKGSSSC